MHLVEEMVVPFAFLLIAHADLHLKNVWSRVTSKALLFESRTWRSCRFCHDITNITIHLFLKDTSKTSCFFSLVKVYPTRPAFSSKYVWMRAPQRRLFSPATPRDAASWREMWHGTASARWLYVWKLAEIHTDILRIYMNIRVYIYIYDL